jgi:TonB family C-terminal domain
LVLSFLFLIIAAIFGLLRSYRVDVLRADVANANAARDAAEYRRVTQETELKTREMAVAGEEAKIAEAENKAAKVGAELSQLQKEKTELETKLEEKQNEIDSLQKRIEEPAATAKPSEKPGAASTSGQQSISPPPPSVEIKPESVQEATPPPQRPRRQKMAPSKAPQVANNPASVSISSAKALAIYTPRPDYPSEARSQRITGSGVCVVSVDPRNGSVTEASMAQSTGDPRLDNAAISAFRKWRFKPGTVLKVKIPIEFQ